MIRIADTSLADLDSSMLSQNQARASRHAVPSDRPNTFSVHWCALLAGVVVVLAAFVVYHKSFSGSFIFDDQLAITANPTIKQLGSALSPPASSTVGGRPLLNLTFALNYALNGTDVWGYHALNLLIHALAGLALFGIVRRTLSRPVLSGCFGTQAVPLALAVAVIWVVHPLQTESVAYISQRAESLMGLFYFLTLYGFIRSADSPAPACWQSFSILACLLGAMSKEIIVTAPVMVLLYDRTFVAGSFREACRLRWRYYLGLSCIWLLLARLMTGVGQRAGFDEGVTWWNYVLTSCRSVVLYAKLAFWPHPLVFDYGINIIQHAIEAAPYALVLAALLVSTAVALWRWPVIGFAGAWFFVILAPTSSVVPVALQPMAEHRLYLSMAAVVAVGVLGLYRLAGRRGLLVCVAAAVGLGWLSVQRNQDYRSELAIWSDTVAKRPDNARAFYNLGNALVKMPNRIPEAITAYEAALRIKPDYAEACYNLGNALLGVPGRLSDAIAEFQAALRIKPDYAEAHYNLGVALLDVPGRLPDAAVEFQAATRIKPDYAEAHNNLGGILSQMPGRMPDAIIEYETALRINPDTVEAHNNLGNALLNMPGRLPDAIAQFEAALRLNPGLAESHYKLGNVLLRVPGRMPDAITEFQAAIRIKPDFVNARNNLGIALAQQGHLAEARVQFEETVRLAPESARAHFDFGNSLIQLGSLSEAIEQYELALQFKPDYVDARRNLELARKMMAQRAAGSKK
ncbi:MAG TPA: tetratricopeptide repeat protein [Opitutaceae bacterium]|nr:tetratricopeptide repeat protein [Opitutaceae bacterium]